MPTETVNIVVNGRENASPMFDRLNQKMGRTEKQIASVNTKFAAFGKTVRQVAGAFALIGAVRGIGEMSTGLLKMGARLETVTLQMRTLLGETGNVTVMMKELQEFAAGTPFEFFELTGAAKQLLAFGFEQQQILPILRDLGNVSAATGARLNELIHTSGEIRAEGRLMGRELRELQRRFVPLLETLAEMFDTTPGKIRERMSAGLISFQDVERAFQRMNEEGGKFFGAMTDRMESLEGKWSNLMDVINKGLGELGIKVAELFTVKDGIGGLTTEVERFTGALKEFVETVDIVKSIIPGSSELKGPAGIGPAFGRLPAPRPGVLPGSNIPGAATFQNPLGIFGLDIDLAQAAIPWMLMSRGRRRGVHAERQALERLGPPARARLGPLPAGAPEDIKAIREQMQGFRRPDIGFPQAPPEFFHVARAHLSVPFFGQGSSPFAGAEFARGPGVGFGQLMAGALMRMRRGDVESFGDFLGLGSRDTGGLQARGGRLLTRRTDVDPAKKMEAHLKEVAKNSKEATTETKRLADEVQQLRQQIEVVNGS